MSWEDRIEPTRLRYPCEHGRYDAHYVGDGLPIFGYSDDVPLQCLGGLFLDEGSIVVKRGVGEHEGEWPEWALRVADYEANDLGGEARRILDGLARGHFSPL